MNTPKYQDVDAALASLPRGIDPPRDLWSGIAAELNAAPRERAPPRWPLALAASLAIASLAGALAWSILRAPAGPAMAGLTARPAQPAAAQIPASFAPPQGAAYVAARAALERTFVERLDLLAPATRTRVQADLAIIRKANEDIREALGKDPASPLLQQLLRSTWQQEIDLYTNVARATDAIATRRT
jgi:hypothetical protein